MLDLNGFKQINDSLGHHAGDQVLCEVSKNLRENVRGFDALARLGGDEFTLIAGLSEKQSVERLADAIREAVETPMLVEGQAMTVTASLGIAIYPDDAQDATRLLRIADLRMYTYKQMPGPQPKQPKLKGLSPTDFFVRSQTATMPYLVSRNCWRSWVGWWLVPARSGASGARRRWGGGRLRGRSTRSR